MVAIPEKGTMASTKEVGLCVSLWIEFHEIKSVVCAIRCKRYIMIFCHGMLKGNHMFLVDNFTRRLMLVICVFGFQWWKGNSTEETIAGPVECRIFPHIGQIYKGDFKTFAERLVLTICSPDSNSGIETCKAQAKGLRSEISGNPRRVSHLDIVLSLTHSFSAS